MASYMAAANDGQSLVLLIESLSPLARSDAQKVQ